MHYFSNKFSKITKRWRISAIFENLLVFVFDFGDLSLRLSHLVFDFGDLKLRDLSKLCFSKLIMTIEL